jgi:hypothetical protein
MYIMLRQMTATIALLSMLLFGCARTDEAGSEAEMAEKTTPATPAAQTASTPPTLDGRRFIVDGGEQGKPSDAKDTLEFTGTMFHSEGCDAWGFESGAYTTAADGDATTFQSTTTSEKEGTIEWKGTVRGNEIEGTYRWTKEGQKPIDYWFKGTMM